MLSIFLAAIVHFLIFAGGIGPVGHAATHAPVGHSHMHVFDATGGPPS